MKGKFMRRFKLVKISRRRVEVQKIRLKINFSTLLIAFLFACLVWLYVAGSDIRNPQHPDSQDTSATMAQTVVEPAELGDDMVEVLV